MVASGRSLPLSQPLPQSPQGQHNDGYFLRVPGYTRCFLSGKLAYLTADIKGKILELKAHYMRAFSYLLIILIIATLACAVLNTIIRKLLSPYKSVKYSVFRVFGLTYK